MQEEEGRGGRGAGGCVGYGGGVGKGDFVVGLCHSCWGLDGWVWSFFSFS